MLPIMVVLTEVESYWTRLNPPENGVPHAMTETNFSLRSVSMASHQALASVEMCIRMR
jgi:hypothetical protein